MLEPAFDLTGKVALVTGASKGIGEAIALAYARAGARLVVSSRKQEAVDAVAARIRERGGDALALAAHTGNASDVDALLRFSVDRFGGVDILVNNAATNPHYGPVISADDGLWDKTLDVNLKGYARMIRAAVPSMKVRGGGKIVNVASIAGLRPAPHMGLYGVTKAAVLMLTQVLAVELAPDNIQVNALAPGFIKTKFSAAVWTNEEVHAAIRRATPMARIGTVDEVTGIALYLASPASSFTTGATFVVDGGLSVAAQV